MPPSSGSRSGTSSCGSAARSAATYSTTGAWGRANMARRCAMTAGFRNNRATSAITPVTVASANHYQVKRLKDLETENARLRKAISDLTLDKLILQEAAKGNF